MDNGWIKIHRKFLDWEWFDKPEMVKFFLTILFLANYEDKKWRGITIKRGQFVTSLQSLSEKTKLSVRSIRTNLERLKSTSEIAVQSTNRHTVITICKYDEYQQREDESDKQKDAPNDKQTTNKRQTNDKQTTTTKEYKNNKKEKNIKEKTFLEKIDRVELYLNLTPDEWKRAVQDWLDYKRTRGELYKSEKTFKSFFEKIKKESGGEISVFVEAVEQSKKTIGRVSFRNRK